VKENPHAIMAVFLPYLFTLKSSPKKSPHNMTIIKIQRAYKSGLFDSIEMEISFLGKICYTFKLALHATMRRTIWDATI